MDRLRRLTDDELLASTRTDAEAFGVFYERHNDAVLTFLAKRTRDAEAALDLTAEVFAAALVASRRYQPGKAPALLWLLGIAQHKLADRHRRRASDMAARRRLGMPRRDHSDADIERVEELIDASDERYIEGLEHLSPAERDAIRARVLDERDYEEMAAETGVSQAALRQRVSRGLARLAQMKEET